MNYPYLIQKVIMATEAIPHRTHEHGKAIAKLREILRDPPKTPEAKHRKLFGAFVPGISYAEAFRIITFAISQT